MSVRLCIRVMAGMGFCGFPELGFLLLLQGAHVGAAVVFRPGLVGLAAQSADQPLAAGFVGEDPNHSATALDLLI